MKKSFKFLSLMLVMALFAVTLSGCAGNNAGGQPQPEQPQPPAEKIVWKLGHLGNEEHIWNKTALKFAELVDEKTNGQIEIKVYPNEQLGNEIDTINMVKAGTADLVVSGESMQNWAPKAALMAVPYAFRDTAHMRKVIESDLGQEIADQIKEKVGITPLYYHVRAPRNLTSNKPISKPEDLKGFKMRVPNVPIFVEAWKAAGANPQAMAFSEVFTALQQGVINGQENPVDLIYSAGFYEVQKYVNETEHVNGWVYVLIGNKQLESLSDDLRSAVVEAAAEAQTYADGLFEEETTGFKNQLMEKGMEFNSNVDKEAFQKAMEPGVKGKLDAEQADLYERIVNFQ
ncbi:TRAP transporter substrate-binding protein [Geosporobacter ferrireducens]|uniref:C4-dicarboxylate ABC transporter n=1 Tax=Geosporobacter ferrireducens TaxID=1424294 RepID=A0A1D8GIM1_9FIRM|nr:TRAP transporter substrate-binding protein [Geosporobacter ferrireducens]AOT70712.1 C4-dicarboxylate ABC transporter [Geosporobacter ferrireducens]MTI57519.1 TRAP transporter substrate-binding protein [Geosporobacter ferrireducens]